jgi:hypothetical protein
MKLAIFAIALLVAVHCTATTATTPAPTVTNAKNGATITYNLQQPATTTATSTFEWMFVEELMGQTLANVKYTG